MKLPTNSQCFLVGGATRDLLLGRPVKDHDFVVCGSSEQAMLDCGFSRVGADFPVFLDERGWEFALARKERKVGPGYNGFETDFSESVTLEEDLERRDLTINALAKAVTGWTDDDQPILDDDIIDFHNGVEDLNNGILRHVSDAFAEDPVRVLRVARFAARYNFDVAPETMELMRTLVKSGELDHLTSERVWLELEKAITEDSPIVFFRVLSQCGAKDVLFPEMGRSLIHSGIALRRASLHQASRIVRMMILFSRLESAESAGLFERLKSPSDVSKMTRKCHQVLRCLHQEVSFTGQPKMWSVSAQDILQTLKDVDAFRQPEDLIVVGTAVEFMSTANTKHRMDTLLEAHKAASKVTFATLPDEVRAGLKGPAVGRAIDEARTEILLEVI